MSNKIDTARSQGYSAAVFHLSQQKGSRLQNAVRREVQKNKADFYDRIGSVSAAKITGRHQDTVYSNTPHSRRMVTMNDYSYADLVDKQDKIRMLHDPTSPYVQAAVWALGRSKDDEIITAALGTAYTGESGTSTQSLGNAQKIAATNGSSAGDNLNIAALINVKEVLMAGEVDPDEELYLACSASQIKSLLNEEKVTSSDYAAIKALVEGKIDTFMGFKFIQTERLNLQSGALPFTYASGAVGSGSGDADGYRRCFAWAKSGLLLATGMDITARVEELPTKNYSTQVYAAGSFGATRMEEAKVVEILCSEA